MKNKKKSKRTYLLVPGFVADTYSEIERSFVELSAFHDPEIQILWLVPDINAKGLTFADDANRTRLSEPAYVSHLRNGNVPYIVANISPYNFIHNYFLFKKIFSQYEIEGVYTHFGLERYWATLFAKLSNKRTIWNEHWHSLGRKLSFAKRIFYKCFVDEYISISRFITRTLPSNSRIHTIPNAIQINPGDKKIDREKNELRGRLGLPTDAGIVLMVAAFRPEKRHALALKICERVIRQVPKKVMFIFLGSGEIYEEFNIHVQNIGMNNSILAPGYVNNVQDYYDASDISILTSLNEPFGYVVLEAMRNKLPVIAFNNGGPAEVIKHNQTGILIEEGDVDEFAEAITDLLGDQKKRIKYGSAAYREVEKHYNRTKWIQDVLSVLRNT